VVQPEHGLGSPCRQGDRFAKAVDLAASLNSRTGEPQKDLTPVWPCATPAAAPSSTCLLNPPATEGHCGSNRFGGVDGSLQEFFDDCLNTLPDAYRVLNREALNGDYSDSTSAKMVLKVHVRLSRCT